MKIIIIIILIALYVLMAWFMYQDGYKTGKKHGISDERIKSQERISEAYYQGKDIGEKEVLKHISPPYLYELSKKMKRIEETTILSADDTLENAKKITEAQNELKSEIGSYINCEIERTYKGEFKYKVWLNIIDEKTDKGEPFDLKGQQT